MSNAIVVLLPNLFGQVKTSEEKSETKVDDTKASKPQTSQEEGDRYVQSTKISLDAQTISPKKDKEDSTTPASKSFLKSVGRKLTELFVVFLIIGAPAIGLCIGSSIMLGLGFLIGDAFFALPSSLLAASTTVIGAAVMIATLYTATKIIKYLNKNENKNETSDVKLNKQKAQKPKED